MKWRMLWLLPALILGAGIGVFAQDTQVGAQFVWRDQRHLGYEPNTIGVKVEGIYRLSDQWVIVGYAMGLRSKKVDSGTGKSGFLSLGTRWAPVTIRGVRLFGEVDGIFGALVTDPYRKTVFHFRAGGGVRALDGERLLLQVSRLFEDVLPDAAKLLEEGNPAFRYTTFNRLRGWDYEAQYWTRPLAEGGRLGLKGGLRYSRSRFVRAFGDLTSGWLFQIELGPYWRF